ncbi:integrase [Prosthecomicrobium hirschii]|uniref:integrase n=1 Tax=Prosthecodimorpha hirschii TaxID=665126 RepID=UPI00221EF442|nr:integrase [Prosthecomicrobium hirschii]MCW1844207.1 integrase [Prosthecomicrobium hirschii]
MEEAGTPGLKRRKRKGGPDALVWVCSDAARLAGFEPRTQNLSHLAGNRHALSVACSRLENQQAAWLSSRDPRNAMARFDGSMLSLFEVYETDPRSTFKKLKPSSAKPYTFYLRKLKASIGSRRMELITGLDITGWHDEIADSSGPAAAAMCVAIIKAALSFGVAARLPGCADLKLALDQVSFPSLPPRRSAPTIDDVQAIIKAAHTTGFPSIAFATALCFDGSIRLWDVIGQWVPVSEPGLSTVLDGQWKWFGPKWEDIRSDMTLTLRPSKTEATTGTEVELDLSVMPLVMAEIEKIPVEQRKGPLIVQDRTRTPWNDDFYRVKFREIRAAAGVRSTLWARDMRAGAITEGRKAGAATDDLAKQAGHTSSRTTSRIYDRDSHLEATRRNMAARIAARNAPGTSSGTDGNDEQ